MELNRTRLVVVGVVTASATAAALAALTTRRQPKAPGERISWIKVLTHP